MTELKTNAHLMQTAVVGSAVKVNVNKNKKRTVFYTKKERVVIDYIDFTEKEFVDILLKEKIKKIFHSYYSKVTPCWVITNYIDKKTIEYFATSWSNKTPQKTKLTDFYRYVSNQDLKKCSFETES